MNILHVIASADPSHGGPIEGIIAQAKHRAEGITYIATLDRPGVVWDVEPAVLIPLGEVNPPWAPLRTVIPGRRYGFTRRLTPWLRENAKSFDLVVVNGLWNYAAFGARRALVGAKTPYVVFTHGMLDPWFKRRYPIKHIAKQLLWLFSEGPLLANARAVMFTADEEEALARNAFWPYSVRCRVINYGTGDIVGDPDRQIDTLREHVPGVVNRRYILFIGRIHPKKGCDMLIEAFSRVASRHRDVDLMIAGPDQVDWSAKLKGVAKRLGIQERVHWPGMLRGDVKWGAFRACEAVILPSHQENFGITVAEALAAARPALISNKVNIWREVAGDGAGLVEPDTVDGTFRLIDRFLAMNAFEKAAMSQNARNCFLSRFEASRAMRSIFTAYADAALGR